MGLILLVVVIGEGLGLFGILTEQVPWWIGSLLVIASGYQIFYSVVRSAFQREVTSHTLMSLGAIAALSIGQWTTAGIVVFFMQVGEYVERFTSEKARGLLKTMTSLTPQTAKVLQDGKEYERSIDAVLPGEVVVVRPGDRIPVDGTVIDGRASMDQSTITGESMPVDVEPGSRVHAATLAHLGTLKVKVDKVGRDTTFGRTIQLVEEAEASRGTTQRLADKFSAWYLPVVTAIALLTYLISGNVLSTVAVMVVACSCSFALATPIAMMATIGAAAGRGLLIKGGKYVEALSVADVLFVDKTGTLTSGKPRITDIIVPLDGPNETTLLTLVATAERYSEHPLAEAVRREAQERCLMINEPDLFEAIPGKGIRAMVSGYLVEIGNSYLVRCEQPYLSAQADVFRHQGKTVVFVALDGKPVGAIAMMDTVRPEVAEVLNEIRYLGIQKIELLTGDNERTASALAASLNIDYRADLLPEQKIAIVREWQKKGHRVVMIGDGVNDGPALAQADVGISMWNGTGVAMEAAGMVLMREDWRLVAESFHFARKTMKVVKANIAFTAIYNIIGLLFAATGFLPPIFAAAAQSLPDIGILLNSSRLIKPVKSTNRLIR